jgi:hypothetical protein
MAEQVSGDLRVLGNSYLEGNLIVTGTFSGGTNETPTFGTLAVTSTSPYSITTNGGIVSSGAITTPGTVNSGQLLATINASTTSPIIATNGAAVNPTTAAEFYAPNSVSPNIKVGISDTTNNEALIGIDGTSGSKYVTIQMAGGAQVQINQAGILNAPQFQNGSNPSFTYQEGFFHPTLVFANGGFSGTSGCQWYSIGRVLIMQFVISGTITGGGGNPLIFSLAGIQSQISPAITSNCPPQYLPTNPFICNSEGALDGTSATIVFEWNGADSIPVIFVNDGGQWSIENPGPTSFTFSPTVTYVYL